MKKNEFYTIAENYFDRIGRIAWSKSLAYRKGLSFEKAFFNQSDFLNCIFVVGVYNINDLNSGSNPDCLIPNGMSAEQFENQMSLIKYNSHVRK